MERLNKTMEFFSKLYDGIAKCKKCAKGTKTDEMMFLIERNSETFKKLLCPKHKKLFEELEDLIG